MIQKLTAVLLLCIACNTGNAQQPLFIPDTLSGTDFSLTLHRDSVPFFPGKITHTLAFNQYSYLGPTLILRQGDDVSITVKNEAGDTSTVHWHGLHVPAKWDGGPHTPILNGATWNPRFTIMDKASTYWYHPHFHGKTAEQVIKGAAGLIIVRDGEEALLDLPRRYGVDDFPVIVQCKQFDSLNQPMPRGMQDSTLLVNGSMRPYVGMPAQGVRLRLLNASGERSFNFGFTNNRAFYVIGNDGGLLAAPVQTTRIPLSPGERAEILIDLSGMNGQSINLMSYASEFPSSVQGGPTMPMPPGEPSMDSPLNGVDYAILNINVGPQTAHPVTAIPSALVRLVKWDAASADITRTITITGKTPMTMDGPFYFNNQSFDMMRIDYRVPLNNTEIWSVTNQSMMAHPFHIHNVQFYILDRDGIAPRPREAGRKDVVMIDNMETVRFIAKFENFADTTVPYMYHCHILMHEDDGMMGQFVVTPATTTNVKETALQQGALSVYPNPAEDEINISLNDPSQGKEGLTISIYDRFGIKQYDADLNRSGTTTLATGPLKNGLYFIRVAGNGFYAVHKLSIRNR